MKHIIRYARLMLGLVLFGIGSYLSIQANVGLAPWDAFQMGIATMFGIQYGNVVILVGIVIVAANLALGEQVGVGTILNILVIGKVIDLLRWLGIVPLIGNFWLGILVMFLGQVFICVGTYFYIGAELGGGPRDSLMVAIGKRLKKVPIGVIRGAIEGTVLLLGWLMGSKVGGGTVLAVFGIGFILQTTFRILHFDVKALRHESIFETLHLRRCPRT